MKRILFVLCTLLFMGTAVFAVNDTITAPESGIFKTDSVCTEFIATSTDTLDTSTVVYNWYIKFNEVLTDGTYLNLPDTDSYVETIVCNPSDTVTNTIDWRDGDPIGIIVTGDTADISSLGIWFTNTINTTIADIRMKCVRDVPDPTAIDNVIAESPYKITYTSMEVTICGCERDEVITIYDMSGRVVKSIRAGSDSVPLRGLNPGVYIANSKRGNAKFVIH